MTWRQTKIYSNIKLELLYDRRQSNFCAMITSEFWASFRKKKSGPKTFGKSGHTSFVRLRVELVARWLVEKRETTTRCDFRAYFQVSSRGRTSPTFWARTQLELWVWSTDKPESVKISIEYASSPSSLLIKIFEIWAQAYLEFFWKLGLLSLEPGAYLLWAKN